MKERDDIRMYMRTLLSPPYLASASFILANKARARAFSATLIKRAAYLAIPGVAVHLIKRPVPTQLSIASEGSLFR